MKTDSYSQRMTNVSNALQAAGEEQHKSNDIKCCIVFQAYGRETLYKQVVFSILTLYYHLNGDFEGIKCVIYTDNSQLFTRVLKNVPLETILLSKKDIAEYKGPASFVHRLKICILTDCMAKYGTDILYLDGDTYFTKSPRQLLDKISVQTSMMHTREYDMSDGGDYEETSWVTARKVIRENEFTLSNRTFKIPFSATMWNAGVLGIAHENAHLLEQVLSLSDQLYSKAAFFSAEQFSFSYILNSNTSLIAADDTIFHYWSNNGKLLFDHHLKDFFKENKNLPVEVLAQKSQELIERKNELVIPEPTVLKKLTHRLRLIAIVTLRGRL